MVGGMCNFTAARDRYADAIDGRQIGAIAGICLIQVPAPRNSAPAPVSRVVPWPDLPSKGS